MRTNGKRPLGILLTVALLFSSLAMSAFTGTEQQERVAAVYAAPVAGNLLYGRGALSALPEAAALVYAYDQLARGVENCAEEISVYDGTHKLSETALQTAYDAYTREYTGHFWLGNSYSYSKSTETVQTVSPSYLMTGGELQSARSAFDHAVADMLASTEGTSGEMERELALHDRLAAEVSYGGGSNAHNAYGALVEGRAVCEGYAEAFQCLLQASGICSFIAVGASVNPSSGTSEGHAWNYVRIGGTFYQTDVTWDDQGNQIYHAYFNQSGQRFLEDHAITQTVYELPSCPSDAASYFSVRGGKLDSYTEASVGKLLSDNGYKVSVYCTGNVQSFISWFSANIRGIAAQACVTGGFTYGYANLGREVILSLTPPAGVTVTAQLTSWNNRSDAVVRLYAASTAASVISTDLAGGSPSRALPAQATLGAASAVGSRYTQSVTFSGVTPGSYQLAVYKPGGDQVRIVSVTASAGSVNAGELAFWLCGDIKGDGVLNADDAIYLYGYTQNPGTHPLSADAHIDGNGTVDAGDAVYLLKHTLDAAFFPLQ